MTDQISSLLFILMSFFFFIWSIMLVFNKLEVKNNFYKMLAICITAFGVLVGVIGLLHSLNFW